MKERQQEHARDSKLEGERVRGRERGERREREIKRVFETESGRE